MLSTYSLRNANWVLYSSHALGDEFNMETYEENKNVIYLSNIVLKFVYFTWEINGLDVNGKSELSFCWK